ncbi:MAG: hypothetical protein ABSC91_11730 [Candidatus Bathyarchaeia archaeon]|jgi:hypothetical protein
MVRRSVAVALGIVCIVLVAGLVAGLTYSTIIINNKDVTYNDYTATHSHTNDEFSTMVNQGLNYYGIATLFNYTLVADGTEIYQLANSSSSWNFSATYAGYVVVRVVSDTTVYAQATYTSYVGSIVEPFHYDQRIDLSPTGFGRFEGLFPILPSTSAQVRVGNTNLSGEVRESIFITYIF